MCVSDQQQLPKSELLCYLSNCQDLWNKYDFNRVTFYQGFFGLRNTIHNNKCSLSPTIYRNKVIKIIYIFML